MYTAADIPVLRRMEPVSLDEMGAVSLMNRTDTKFVMDFDRFMGVLEAAAASGYRVCEIEGQRLMPYSSVYYDTPDLRMFTDHRNRKLVRQKVRVRTYLVGGETYLEIKRKNNHGRTKKKRVRIPSEYIMDLGASEQVVGFMERKCLWTPSELTPETTTDFSRITLVNPAMTERVTCDLNLRFSNFRSGVSASLDGLVIVELKRDGNIPSRMKEILTGHRVFPYRLSKYCVAVTLTDPAARPGRYKEKIRRIEKITGKRLI